MQVDDGDRRGRKRKRSISSDESMDGKKTASKSAGKKSTMGRSLTPAQLKIRAQSKVRSLTQGRREGSVPQYHPTRVVPEEQIRLAKKINKRFKHSVNVNEADRVVTTAKPKHLFSGKRSNGKNDRRWRSIIVLEELHPINKSLISLIFINYNANIIKYLSSVDRTVFEIHSLFIVSGWQVLSL